VVTAIKEGVELSNEVGTAIKEGVELSNEVGTAIKEEVELSNEVGTAIKEGVELSNEVGTAIKEGVELSNEVGTAIKDGVELSNEVGTAIKDGVELSNEVGTAIKDGVELSNEVGTAIKDGVELSNEVGTAIKDGVELSNEVGTAIKDGLEHNNRVISAIKAGWKGKFPPGHQADQPLEPSTIAVGDGFKFLIGYLVTDDWKRRWSLLQSLRTVQHGDGPRCMRGYDGPHVVVGPMLTFRSGDRYGDGFAPRSGFPVPNPSSPEGISVEGFEPPDDDLLTLLMRSRGVIDPILFNRRVQLGELELVSKGTVLAVGTGHDLTRSIQVHHLEPRKGRDGYLGCITDPGTALGERKAGGMQLAFLVHCLQLNAEGNPGEFFDDAGKLRAAVRNPGVVSRTGKPDAFLKIRPRRGQWFQGDVLEEGVVGERAEDAVFHRHGLGGAERGQGVQPEQHGNGNLHSHRHLQKVVFARFTLEYPYTCYFPSFKNIFLLSLPAFRCVDLHPSAFPLSSTRTKGMYRSTYTAEKAIWHASIGAPGIYGTFNTAPQIPSKTARTFFARSSSEKGFWIKFTPSFSTPWWAMMSAV